VPHELPDHSDRLFGREKDLAALAARVRCKGLTTVVARPQMGKSWLLTELARRLSLTHEPRHLVGFAEQVGQTPDLLVRAVADLYARWLSDAEQAGMIWKQQKDRLLPGVAGTLGKIFSEVFGTAAKPVTVVVDEAIKGLVAANETLTSGGLKLPVLHYDQARDLVTAVAHLSDRPIALFLDQWEGSSDATMESRTLDNFLRHLDDWPACHLFLALRPDEPAYGAVEALARSMPGTAHVYPLDLMNLAEARDREGHAHPLALSKAAGPAELPARAGAGGTGRCRGDAARRDRGLSRRDLAVDQRLPARGDALDRGPAAGRRRRARVSL
jgi:hypothetical protein